MPGLVHDAHAAAAEHLLDFMTWDLGHIRPKTASPVGRPSGELAFRRRKHRIQFSVAGEFSPPTLAHLWQQFGAIAAHLFWRLL